MDLPEQARLQTFREWFKNSVTAESEWRREAREDVEFYSGQQWDPLVKAALQEKKRPSITINRTRPLINLLSGYQRLNRYEPDFLPRTGDDLEKCKVAKGVTKYIFDQQEFDSVESRVALDSFLTGRGWYYVRWKWDWESAQGDVSIQRISPFDIYLDPECREADLSDAEHMHHAHWVSKDKVMQQFPEAKDVVEAAITRYDQDEESIEAEPLWYADQRKKVRIVNTWYRSYDTEKYLILADGQILPESKANSIARMVAVDSRTAPKCTIRVATYIGDLLLEDVESPYGHGMFPFIMFPSYWLGEGDIPAGVVRDLKDPQREMNKRRSQLLHIVNTMASRGWKVQKGSMSSEEKDHLQKHGAEAGVVLEYSGERPPQEFAMDQIPSGFFSLDKQSEDDLHEISGINEAMMGLAPASQSGRAKELDQRQAVVQITMLFDHMRTSKKRVLKLLWGKQNKPGLIPQYYKEPRMFRITQDSGQPDFVPVNQPQMAIDPRTGQTITQVLNDLSTFQFDIIISDTPATPSQRVASFYALLEMAKSGIPVPPDMILEASDLPQKEQLKQRMAAAQQPQQLPPQQGAPPGMPSGQPGGPPLTQMPPGQGPSPAQIQQIIGQMRG